MQKWLIALSVLTLIAGVVSYGGLFLAAAGIAKVVFVACGIVLVAALFAHALRERSTGG
jgi:uncharacterized membrane protein YtjA (UPF0391 family)